MEDDKKFKEMMAVAGEVFDKQISESLVKIYWQTLKKYSDEQVEKAFGDILTTKTMKIFPLPGELVQAIEGSSTDKAQQAWMLFNNTMRTTGTWQSVKFTDPVIHTVVVSLGGWTILGKMDESEWPFIQARFIKEYEQARRRNTHPEYLAGENEMANFALGYTDNIEKPVLVGPDDKIMIAEGGS